MAYTTLQNPKSALSLLRDNFPRPVCPPPAVIGTPRTVTAPVGPVRGVGTRPSNLDLNGRLVKRGVVVSANGWRYLVVKVSRGFAYGRLLNLLGRHPAGKTTTRLVCAWVQVVQ